MDVPRRRLEHCRYPTSDSAELRVAAGFASNPDPAARHDVAAQQAYTLAQCAGLGGDLGAVGGTLPQTQRFYYGYLAQVRLPR